MSIWLLKLTSGSLDGVSRRQLLESLNCKRQEKATISNTDDLTQFTAGLDEWKGRIAIYITLFNLNHVSFSQRLVSWRSAFQVRKRVNTVSFSGSLPRVAMKLNTALPDFNKVWGFLLSIGMGCNQSLCISFKIFIPIYAFSSTVCTIGFLSQAKFIGY